MTDPLISHDDIMAAIKPNTGELDPRFCITCYRLLDWREQDWFWNGDNHAPEHFTCRNNRLTRGEDR